MRPPLARRLILTLVWTSLSAASCSQPMATPTQTMRPEPSPRPTLTVPATAPVPEPTPTTISPSVHFFEFRVNDETCQHTGEGLQYELLCGLNPGDRVTVFAEVDDDSEGDLRFLGDEYWYLPKEEAILEGQVPEDLADAVFSFYLHAYDGYSLVVEIHFDFGEEWPLAIEVPEPYGFTGEVELEIRVTDRNADEGVRQIYSSMPLFQILFMNALCA